MTRNSFVAKIALASCVLALSTQPVFADVKDGVDAWSRGEYENAVKQWREPALKGDPDAQFNMGQAYKMGRGVKTDLAVALEWYRKASTAGHEQAADSQGHLLHYMGKVPESLPYLQASAERGDPRAQYLLATELFNGVYVGKDWVRAYALMTRASSAGMAQASRSLAQMDQYIPLDQRQRATALAGELERQTDRSRVADTASPPAARAAPAIVFQPAKVIASKTPTATAPAQPVKVATTVTSTKTVQGKWRVQLGAFGKADSAQMLWDSLKTKHNDLAGLQLFLEDGDKLTRLQAGPFASRSAANAMCVKLKTASQPCLVISG